MHRTILALLNALTAVTASQAQVTDTLGWEAFHQSTETLFTSPSGGFAFGNNGYGDLAKAQSYHHDESLVLRKVLLRFGAAQLTSGDPESKVRVNIYDNRGFGMTTIGMVGMSAPDSILDYRDLALSDIITGGGITEVDFGQSGPVIFDRFSVGIDLSGIAPGDTVGLLSTADGEAGGREEVWEQEADSTWITVLSMFSWELDVNLAIFPVVDVNDPLGMNDAAVPGLSVFPNPTSDIVNIQFPGHGTWTTELHSVDGRLLSHQTFSSDRTTLDLSAIQTGIYLLRVHNSTDAHVSRVVVTH